MFKVVTEDDEGECGGMLKSYGMRYEVVAVPVFVLNWD